MSQLACADPVPSHSPLRGLKGETTIDPALLKDLTEQANAVSESLTHLLGGLHVQLLAVRATTLLPFGRHSFSEPVRALPTIFYPLQTSHITLQSVEAYALGVDQVNKTVEGCVEETVALINKADELNANMAPIHQLAAQMCVFPTLERTQRCTSVAHSLVLRGSRWRVNGVLRKDIKRTLDILEATCK